MSKPTTPEQRRRSAATARARSSGGPPIVPIAIGAIVVVALLGLVIAVVGGGDDDGAGTATEGDQQAELRQFADITVEGDPLPDYPGADADDPAVGQPAPTLDGQAPDGTPTTAAEGDEPTLLAFLAHWCPHCQAELPELVELAPEGTLDGVRTVVVLTGTNPDAPNYPPTDWLEREGWEGDVVVDNERFSAATAYGLTGYPYLVAVDADGNVVDRVTGELTADQFAALAAAAQGE